MDPSNLRTASTYINNLLLARGLLRHGTPVDFAWLACEPIAASNPDSNKTRLDSKEHETTKTNQVAVEVMNLVHDLILRRDRDQDHQETLADNLRTLRSEAALHSSTVARLTTQNRDIQQQNVTCHSQLRGAQSTTNAAEALARRLREELSRTKSVLAQVRQQCEKDVKRRDLQLERLKTHLNSQQRGSNKSSSIVGPTITITPGSLGGTRKLDNAVDADVQEPPSLQDAEYSLQQETTEFLTQLSSNLSDENDALIGLLRSTLTTLRGLLGQPAFHPQHKNASGQVSGRQNTEKSDILADGEIRDPVRALDTSYDTLSGELGSALASLQELLTNPSFAPIEEVHIREDEIRRLRQGWEKMEARWREAVGMMQGWRKRMVRGGDTVNLEDLKRGLGLGKGLEGPDDHVKGVASNIDLSEDEEMDDNDRHADLAEDNEPDIADLPEDEESFVAQDRGLLPTLQDASSRGAEHVLKEGTANIEPTQRSMARSKPEQENATTHSLGSNRESVASESMDQGGYATKESDTSQRDSLRLASRRGIPKKSQNGPNLSPTKSTSRSELTVEQKLKLASEEARRVSSQSPHHGSRGPAAHAQGNLARKPVARSASTKRKADSQSNAATHVEPESLQDDVACAADSPQKPVKRTRIPSAISRANGRRKRKSTLSPEELEELMGLVRREDALLA